MRISVVIPSYDHGRYVEQAIDSIAAQDDPEVEIVVVDDGSHDDSVERIRARLAAADVAGTVLHEQRNAGAHAAIDKGLDLASGDCLTILNSDDFFLPGRLTRIRERVGDRERYLLFTGVSFVDERSQPLDPAAAHARWYEAMLHRLDESPTLGFALLRDNPSVTSGNLVFSRRLRQEVGPFADLRFCHDWDFVMRATRIVEPERIPEPLLGYRVHDANASHGLREVQEREARRALNDFLAACREGTPPNPLAPCPANWPSFFALFAARHAFHFGTRPIADYLDEGGAAHRAA